MAKVQLRRSDLTGGDLPGVCICCGAPTEGFTRTVFHWSPLWIRLLGRFWARAFGQQVRAQIPVCDAHRNHWLWRWWLMRGSLVLIVVPSLLAFAYFESGWWLLPAIAWFGLSLCLWFTMVRVSAITGQSVTLVGVSEKFAKAVEESRANAPPADDEEEEFFGWGAE